MKELKLLALLILTTTFSFGQEKEDAKADQPLNIILMIGDGMGLSQISAGIYFGDGPSSFERFPVVGLSKTSSGSHKITDSAAGATAFSCGEKTYNGAIGMNMDKEPSENIVEILSRVDYQTGVVVTSSVTHATPASFYAHVISRSMDEEIARQLFLSEIDFFAGGGLDFFTRRKDSVDLLQVPGVDFEIQTKKLLSPRSLRPDKKYGILLAADGMPTMIEGRGDFLSDAVELSLAYFEKVGKPYFLMIEGSQIDWGGHDNNADYLISEQLDFDKTIGMVLDYATKKGNTLVIVTADHETGGFTLSKKTETDKDGKTRSNYDAIGATFSTGGHSGTMIPVFAFGPGSEKFGGVYENTEIFQKMLSLTP